MTVLYSVAAAIWALITWTELTGWDGTKFGAFMAGLSTLGFLMLAAL